MAFHTELTIFKTAEQLFDLASDNLVVNMPRKYKSSLGREIISQCVGVSVAIAKANGSRNKVPHLETVIDHTEGLNFLLRQCVGRRAITRAHYANAIQLTTSIGKQANGWKKSPSASSPAA